MLDIMYDLPAQENVKTCTISAAVVLGEAHPVLKYRKSSA